MSSEFIKQNNGFMFINSNLWKLSYRVGQCPKIAVINKI